MANVPVDTPTPALGLRLQPSQQNRGIWGSNLNEVLMKIDQVFTKLQITAVGGTVVIDKENFLPDEATPMVVEIVGTLSSTLTVVFPQANRYYAIINKTVGAFAVNVGTGGGTSRVIPQGSTALVLINGADAELISSPVNAAGSMVGAFTASSIDVAGSVTAGSFSTSGNLTVGGGLSVTGPANMGNISAQNLSVSGSASATDMTLTGTFYGTHMSLSGNASVGGTFSVAGVATFQSSTSINTLSVTNDATVGGNLTVTGQLIANNFTITNLNLNNLTAAGTVATSGLTVSSNAVIAGSTTTNLLSVTTNATIGGTLTATGNVLTNGSSSAANFVATVGLSTFLGIQNNGALNTSTMTTTGDVSVGEDLSVTGSGVFGSTITLGVGPTSPNHAATKQYVDSLAQGQQWKESVRASTVSNITLSGTQTVDGIALIGGDRILVKNQTNPVENGIYIVTGGAWGRSADADADAELAGMTAYIREGTVNAGDTWIMSTPGPTIAGPKVFVQFSGAGSAVQWSNAAW